MKSDTPRRRVTTDCGPALPTEAPSGDGGALSLPRSAWIRQGLAATFHSLRDRDTPSIRQPVHDIPTTRRRRAFVPFDFESSARQTKNRRAHRGCCAHGATPARTQPQSIQSSLSSTTHKRQRGALQAAGTWTILKRSARFHYLEGKRRRRRRRGGAKIRAEQPMKPRRDNRRTAGCFAWVLVVRFTLTSL